MLLIDDEVAVVRATKDLLENFGYEVRHSHSRRARCDSSNRVSSAFDVVVTDNLMPEMTGLELAQAIRESDAAIPIVLMSGYSTTRPIAIRRSR